MKLSAIGPGDVVLVSKGGRHVFGKVQRISGGVLHFEPLQRGVSWRHASAREVIDHWRHARRRRGPGEPAGLEDVPPPAAPREQLSLAGRLERQPGAGGR